MELRTCGFWPSKQRRGAQSRLRRPCPVFRTDLAGGLSFNLICYSWKGMARAAAASIKPAHRPIPFPFPLTPAQSLFHSYALCLSLSQSPFTVYGIGYSSAPKVVKKMPSTLVDSQNSFSLRALVHNKALSLYLCLSLSLLNELWHWVGQQVIWTTRIFWALFLSRNAHRLMCKIWLVILQEIGLSESDRLLQLKGSMC